MFVQPVAQLLYKSAKVVLLVGTLLCKEFQVVILNNQNES